MAGLGSQGAGQSRQPEVPGDAGGMDTGICVFWAGTRVVAGRALVGGAGAAAPPARSEGKKEAGSEGSRRRRRGGDPSGPICVSRAGCCVSAGMEPEGVAGAAAPPAGSGGKKEAGAEGSGRR